MLVCLAKQTSSYFHRSEYAAHYSYIHVEEIYLNHKVRTAEGNITLSEILLDCNSFTFCENSCWEEHVSVLHKEDFETGYYKTGEQVQVGVYPRPCKTRKYLFYVIFVSMELFSLCSGLFVFVTETQNLLLSYGFITIYSKCS